MYTTVKLNLKQLRDLAGLSISDVHRITGASRTTIYALESGKSVRRTTVVAILQAMQRDQKCSAAKGRIRQELSTLGVTVKEHKSVRELIDLLEATLLDVEAFASKGNSSPVFENLNEFQSLVEDMSASLQTILENQLRRSGFEP